MPESKRHLWQRTTLYQILDLAFSQTAAIGCDQFVYWDPTDPSQCLAPDAFVRLGVPDDQFRSWKVWERGAPHVAVEIISSEDARDRNWDDKLEKYRRLGIQELVRFDPESEPMSLRIWDRVEGDLVERAVVGWSAASQCLPGFWVVVEDSRARGLLRLSHDPEGKHLYPTPAEREAEARQREAEARQREAEARQREAEARAAAERRIRELEAELRRRG
nr:MAG: Uma2 family endonuclease [Pseudomonadota bacterium]